MLKICPRCHRTFSGGRACPRCADAVALLDVADPRTRPHLRERELRHTINTYYGARSAMLLLFGGILAGALAAVVVARRAFLAPPGARGAWLAAAALAFAGCVAAALLGGSRVVHLFSRVCRVRPPTLEDLRADLRSRRG